MHLNGRVYDALLARFTSADPTVTDPMNMQGWNRYSYVGNDPLAFTDPNGFSWKSFWHGVSHFFTGVANFFKQNLTAILQITLNVVLNVATGWACVPCVAAASAAIMTGISGGNLGQVLKAAAIAGVTSFAMQGIGPAPSLASIGTNPIGYGVYVAENAAVGCASSVASGGSCKSGALSAGVGAAISPVTNSVFQNPLNNVGDLAGGTIVQATVGGLASVAGGGKFANGAVTAGFQYLATVSLERAIFDVHSSEGNGKWQDSYDGDPSRIGHNGGPPLEDGVAWGRVVGRFFGAAGFYFASTVDVGSDDGGWATLSGMLRDAASGKGNFSIGSAISMESGVLGEAWVGPGYRVTSKGYLESADGLRLYRPAEFKPMWKNEQSNFMSRYEPSGPWINNGHLTIK